MEMIQSLPQEHVSLIKADMKLTSLQLPLDMQSQTELLKTQLVSLVMPVLCLVMLTNLRLATGILLIQNARLVILTQMAKPRQLSVVSSVHEWRMPSINGNTGCLLSFLFSQSSNFFSCYTFSFSS